MPDDDVLFLALLSLCTKEEKQELIEELKATLNGQALVG